MGGCFSIRGRTAAAAKAGAERKECVLAAGAELERRDGAALAAELEAKLAETVEDGDKTIDAGPSKKWTIHSAAAELHANGPKQEGKNARQ